MTKSKGAEAEAARFSLQQHKGPMGHLPPLQQGQSQSSSASTGDAATRSSGERAKAAANSMAPLPKMIAKARMAMNRRELMPHNRIGSPFRLPQGESFSIAPNEFSMQK
jgi:hypothetical protein